MSRMRLAHRTFDGFSRALDIQIEEFGRLNSAVRIETTALEVPDLYRSLVSEGGLTGGDFDLAIVLTDWLPALIADGLIQPLDADLTAHPPQDWPDGWSETVLSLQRDGAGRTYGLPYHDGPEALIYRTDLFEDGGECALFERRYHRPLEPPRTWAEFLQVAEFFHRPEEDLFGCVVAGYPDGHNTVYDFLLQLWSRGGEVLDTDGRPAFADSAGIDALRWLHDLVVVRGLTQPDPLGADSVRSGDFFATGRAAMMWNWIGFGIVAEMSDSAIRGRIRCAPIPGATLSVYWVLAIASGSRNPDLAYEFLRHVATPRMDRVTAEAGGVGCRLSTWRDAEIQRRFPPYALMEQAHANARTLPQTVNYPIINEALNEAIDDVYRGRAEPATALAKAARQINGRIS